MAGDDPFDIVDYPGGEYGSDVFLYDENENLTYEGARTIELTYNLLNLPEEEDFGSNRKIHYFYTYDGEKVRQTVEDNGSLTKIDYCGPFVYQTASGTRSLKYIVTPEGRAVKSGSSWDYEYNLKDHLGNTRTVIRSNSGVAQVVQEWQYYPFGMEMTWFSGGSSTNKYLYNGKELEIAFDLNWYDYGARFYDPALGRFHSVDPKAEDFQFQSPFVYASNNPILFIYLNG